MNRQQKYEDKMRASGFTQVKVWVHKLNVHELKRLMAKWRGNSSDSAQSEQEKSE